MIDLRLCAAVLLASSATAALAADGPGTIVVTGNELPAPAGAAAYSTTTIDAARLDSETGGRLEDLLRDVAGFQQFRRTDSRAANPTSQGATLRALGGNASSRALVLLDGVPQADPFAGYIPFSAIAPERLSAARITRGGGAGAFGAGAVAGTIELFTAGLDAPPQASIAYGSRDSLTASASGAAPLGAGYVAVGARLDRGDGYVLIPENQRGAVDIPARYNSKSLSLRVVAPISDEAELQVSGLYFDDDRLRGSVGTASNSSGADASVRLVAHGRWGVEALAYVQERSFSSGFISIAPGRNTATPSLDQFNTPATGLGAKVELRPPVGDDNLLQIGADVRDGSGDTHERFRFQTGSFARLRDAGGDTRTVGLYAEDSWTATPWLTLTGGGRVDRWDIGDGHLIERDLASGAVTQSILTASRGGWQPTGRVGAIVKLTDGFNLRAAGYLGFRLPTPNELYRPFRVGADATAANPGLGLEKLRGAEVGADWKPFTGATLSLTAYANTLRHAISNVTEGAGPATFDQVGFVAAGGAFRVRENVDSIQVHGLEATADFIAGPWTLDTSAAYSDARVHASGIAVQLDGLRPANSPVVSASGTLGWSHGIASTFVTARYTGHQYDDDLQSRRLASATTVDGTLRVKLRHGLTAEARVENAFNVLVESGLASDGTIDRGTPRTVWLGLRLGGR